ncbi:uncharacterized protein LOC101862730 [Aplysia californica]|uniref:Uncharacterized protein LOC101862730 n=1 Tax=Aplysia californica TaxID=6500 RepID=A0ABM0JR33_APLCA|nr:uncharacterized protein LOC101862730 [Aplysia californica]
MRVSTYLFLLLACLLLVQAAKWRRRRRRSTCATHPRLRDKWHFLSHSRRVFVRIRAHQVVFRHGSAKVIKYRCVENTGNIYLLRKRNIHEKQDGVLCLGFSYIADHPKAEYAVLRLIGPGEGTHLMSPVIVPRKAELSIKSTCDLDGESLHEDSDHITNAFIRRALPGCKFPAQIQGRWNFTYQHARSLEIWSRNATLHLMNGKNIKFLCDKRDGGVFVFRTSQYTGKHEDAIMCAEFTPMPEDPFYSFQVSRHNSGNLLDGQLKSVSRSKPIYVHVDCDWIGSPARPEFLYP